jgi:glycolate oxidase FAD binding subunit
MSKALASPHDVSAVAYLASGSAIGALTELVALRLEGPEPSVAYRRERLVADIAEGREAALLDDAASADLWRAVGHVEPLAGLAERTVWRISAAPARGAEIGEAIARALDAAWYLDWGGGLIWVAILGAEDGGAAAIRAVIRDEDGRGTGHATLIKGSAALRGAVPVFEPQPPALAALAARVKDAFDPHHILNPGRIVEQS